MGGSAEVDGAKVGEADGGQAQLRADGAKLSEADGGQAQLRADGAKLGHAGGRCPSSAEADGAKLGEAGGRCPSSAEADGAKLGEGGPVPEAQLRRRCRGVAELNPFSSGGGGRSGRQQRAGR